jgi:hypothetical protein
MGKTFNGRPIVELHDTEGSLPMLMSWCMTGLSTERSGDAGVLPKRFPESFTLLNIVGAAVGKGSRFIVSTRAGDSARKNRELMSLVAYMCAYGVFSICDQGLIGGNERFFKAWNIPFDFGWGNPDVEQFQYWNEEKKMPMILPTASLSRSGRGCSTTSRYCRPASTGNSASEGTSSRTNLQTIFQICLIL